MDADHAMRQDDKQTMARSRVPHRPLVSSRYVAVVGLAVAFGLAGWWVPPRPLGLLAGVVIVLLGALAWRRHRALQMANDPRWREVMPCYLSVQDRDLRILETNNLFRRDFGAGIGESCFHVYKGRDSPCPNCPVLKTFADGQNHSAEEAVITKDGRAAEVVVTSAPLRNRKGDIVAVVEMSTNITEVKQLQHELAMVGIAVAGMTHRIKNILTGLEGGIFVVNTGLETDDHGMVTEGWEMVTRNVTNVSRIAKDLLYCAKEREPDLEDGVAPAAIVREVCELYRARAATEGIELVLEAPEPARVGRFDAEALQNLVTNLVANAIDACRFDPATHKQHRIELACRPEPGGGTVVEVGDNGAGIAEEVSHKMFRGFFSVKGTEGTGIGLLVVRKVAEAHGGTVTFRTKEGEGTTFRVVFPLLAAGGEPGATPAEPTEPT